MPGKARSWVSGNCPLGFRWHPCPNRHCPIHYRNRCRANRIRIARACRCPAWRALQMGWTKANRRVGSRYRRSQSHPFPASARVPFLREATDPDPAARRSGTGCAKRYRCLLSIRYPANACPRSPPRGRREARQRKPPGPRPGGWEGIAVYSIYRMRTWFPPWGSNIQDTFRAYRKKSCAAPARTVVSL